jgi:hypothetical protein
MYNLVSDRNNEKTGTKGVKKEDRWTTQPAYPKKGTGRVS